MDLDIFVLVFISGHCSSWFLLFSLWRSKCNHLTGTFCLNFWSPKLIHLWKILHSKKQIIKSKIFNFTILYLILENKRESSSVFVAVGTNLSPCGQTRSSLGRFCHCGMQEPRPHHHQAQVGCGVQFGEMPVTYYQLCWHPTVSGTVPVMGMFNFSHLLVEWRNIFKLIFPVQWFHVNLPNISP